MAFCVQNCAKTSCDKVSTPQLSLRQRATVCLSEGATVTKGGGAYDRSIVIEHNEVVLISIIMISLKGPQGPQGFPGEKGPAGEGLPGPKVNTSSFSECSVRESCQAYEEV